MYDIRLIIISLDKLIVKEILGLIDILDETKIYWNVELVGKKSKVIISVYIKVSFIW